eukprot:CAMPEP_0185038984 /NCGR_PEP_ID=MMETSP1103-20130426/35307_1 /TAXON_ID=36769 /ORGANISM="Paraphysomonas bandaiensis, Strain Caron Lab Isolate" /LENGTH=709 /DNA_ID=CAMNT_0027577675 /DNA_START=251 /DNA_END=2377 /DNA_ORIENTATION=-
MTIGQLRSFEIEKLVQITGTVIRTGSVQMLKVSKEYECTNTKCGFRFRVRADPEQGNVLPQPRRCPSTAIPIDDGGNRKRCTSTSFREVEGSGECVDYQEIKIQDQMERLAAGHSPQSIYVVLEADLVDKCNPGDDVIVVGTLVRRWRSVRTGSRCQVTTSLKANSIRSLHEGKRRSVAKYDFSVFANRWKTKCKDGIGSTLLERDRILRAVCPQLHGMAIVKLCLLLTLIGGSTAAASGPSQYRRRCQSHMLVVGDPGSGKSQLLRFASSLLPRSVCTTGVGTTGAGLTCTAVREGSEWSVEAGALVLANDGVCCIDEFSSIKEQDRATIHEAMEQQTCSVAKAGLVVKLNTRCSVIAVCNPKGSYDLCSDVTTNTAIAAPLLSRFDLVLVLLDIPQKEWDRDISTALLLQAVNGPRSAQSVPGSGDNFWTVETLRKYVMVIRDRLQPTMTTEARCLLMRYYQMQRQKTDRSSARTTVRLLESSMRLAEAHAKLMFREEVLVQDAVVSIYCMELSSHPGCSLDRSRISPLRADFPSDPEADYVNIEDNVFLTLQYTRAMLKVDALNIGGLNDNDFDTKSERDTTLPHERNNSNECYSSRNGDHLHAEYSDECRQAKRQRSQSERTSTEQSTPSDFFPATVDSNVTSDSGAVCNSHCEIQHTASKLPVNNDDSGTQEIQATQKGSIWEAVKPSSSVRFMIENSDDENIW